MEIVWINTGVPGWLNELRIWPCHSCGEVQSRNQELLRTTGMAKGGKKGLNIELGYNLVIPLLGTCPRELKRNENPFTQKLVHEYSEQYL